MSPPILRAIQTAAKKLESAGHKVVPIPKFPSYSEATELAFNFFDIDNSETGHKFITDSGEPVVKSVADMYTPPAGGRPTRTLDNFLDMTASRSRIQETWHKIFLQNELDVLIAPGSQKTAVPHDTFKYPPYTTYWNLLDVSILSCWSENLRPMHILTSANSTQLVSSLTSKLINRLTYPGLNIKKIVSTFKPDVFSTIAKMLIAADDAEAIDGAPCNIQVVARAEHDEELIAAVEVIAKDLGV